MITAFKCNIEEELDLLRVAPEDRTRSGGKRGQFSVWGKENFLRIRNESQMQSPFRNSRSWGPGSAEAEAAHIPSRKIPALCHTSGYRTPEGSSNMSI